MLAHSALADVERKTSPMTRVASIGECMIELSHAGNGWLARSWGGDTLNTAVYLARLGVAVDYVTALGDDPLSDEMLQAWQVEGVGTGLVVRVLGATGRGARGFVPAGHTGTTRGTDLRKAFKIGTQIDAKIIEVDPRRGEPKLSIRAMKEDEERRAHREYRQALQREGGFGTLGDLLAKKLKAGSDEGGEPES